MVWWPNGKKRAETNYQAGVPHGWWVEWDEEGGKVKQAYFENGRREGVAKFWNEYGQLLMEPLLLGHFPDRLQNFRKTHILNLSLISPPSTGAW